MTPEEKSSGYRRIALDVLDYVENCARKEIKPLVYDVNVYRQRFNVHDKSKVER